MKRLGLIIFFNYVSGCTPINQQCGDDQFCTETSGVPGSRCLFNGSTGTSCAYPDQGCNSGFRWIFAAGPMSSACVPPVLVPDAGSAPDGREG